MLEDNRDSVIQLRGKRLHTYKGTYFFRDSHSTLASPAAGVMKAETTNYFKNIQDDRIHLVGHHQPDGN